MLEDEALQSRREWGSSLSSSAAAAAALDTSTEAARAASDPQPLYGSKHERPSGASMHIPAQLETAASWRCHNATTTTHLPGRHVHDVDVVQGLEGGVGHLQSMEEGGQTEVVGVRRRFDMRSRGPTMDVLAPPDCSDRRNGARKYPGGSTNTHLELQPCAGRRWDVHAADGDGQVLCTRIHAVLHQTHVGL